MTDENNPSSEAQEARKEFDPTKKKILENKTASGLVVPLAIVLVGALIVFGVTKMLSSGRDYRDLVQEMQSKTFGNRWVAAYELSKFVRSNSIPREELPWLIENLTKVFETSNDQRTKNFIILTFGALKHRDTLSLIEKAIDDPDPQVAFNAIVAAGNLPKELSVDWSKIMNKVTHNDTGIRHAAILSLATKNVSGAQTIIEQSLADENPVVKYAAATALVKYKSLKAVPVIKEILTLKESPIFDSAKLQTLKLNLVSTIGREGWDLLQPDLESLVDKTNDVRLETTTREALNRLKK